jgi:hypothetical protein
MFKCLDCDKEFKSLAGLSGHKQFKHSRSSGKLPKIASSADFHVPGVPDEYQLAASSSKRLQATGVMLAGKEASQQLWGWRSGMPMVNFIDTVLVMYFKDMGVVLNEDGSWYQVEVAK